MKKTLLFAFICAINLFFTGCNDDDFEYENEYELSYKTWLNFKDYCNDAYMYTVVSYGMEALPWKSSIYVANGKVFARSFKYYEYSYEGWERPEEELEWYENQYELNTHSSGAETITLDEIYQRAKTDWLIERENTRTYFETENTGMISFCGYEDIGCVCSCFIGVKIMEICPIYFLD